MGGSRHGWPVGCNRHWYLRIRSRERRFGTDRGQRPPVHCPDRRCRVSSHLCVRSHVHPCSHRGQNDWAARDRGRGICRARHLPARGAGSRIIRVITMKMIIAIIKPERFEFVKKALEDKGYISMTVTEVKGRGAQKGITLEYRGGKMTVDLLPKVKLEIVIHDKDVDDLIATLTGAARTGKIGDGKIFVVPVEKDIRIRTGDMES